MLVRCAGLHMRFSPDVDDMLLYARVRFVAESSGRRRSIGVRMSSRVRRRRICRHRLSTPRNRLRPFGRMTSEYALTTDHTAVSGTTSLSRPENRHCTCRLLDSPDVCSPCLLLPPHRVSRAPLSPSFQRCARNDSATRRASRPPRIASTQSAPAFSFAPTTHMPRLTLHH